MVWFGCGWCGMSAGAMRLNVFFSYFGGKWHLAKKYPMPEYKTIVEPFCGSAGYSLHYPHLDIRLNDLNPIVAGLWAYLIKVTEQEILGLPDTEGPGMCEEARWLVGFWHKRGGATPFGANSGWKHSDRWPKAFWGEYIRHRIAAQLQYIRHWKVTNLSYEKLPSKTATWFIDPPYQEIKNRYPTNTVNYPNLKRWVEKCPGQVMVCEGGNADWLPFQDLTYIKTGANTLAKEKLFYRRDPLTNGSKHDRF